MIKIDITFFRLLFALACVGFVSLVASVLFLASMFHYWLKHEREQRKIRYKEEQARLYLLKEQLEHIDAEYRSTGRF